MPETPFRLVRSCALPDERFRYVSSLVSRLRELAAGEPLGLCRSWLGRAAQPTGECVAVRTAAGVLVGYAFAPREALEQAVAADPPKPRARRWARQLESEVA